MMAIAGALMSLVVATLNPLVNEVLLANPPKVEHATASDEPAAFLDRVLDRLPIDQVKSWIHERPMAKVPVLLVTIFLLRGILLFFGDYLTRKTGSAIIRDLRADLHDSLIYQAPSFYRRHQTGEVLSRLLNDVHLIKLMSTQVFSDFFRVAAMAPAMLVLVLIYDWKLTLFALIVLPVMGYPVMRLGQASPQGGHEIAAADRGRRQPAQGIGVRRQDHPGLLDGADLDRSLSPNPDATLRGGPPGEPGGRRLGTDHRVCRGPGRRHSLLLCGPGHRLGLHRPRQLHRRARRA